MTRCINGGLEVKSSQNEEKNSGKKTNFDPVLSMLTEPSSELGVITVGSFF